MSLFCSVCEKSFSRKDSMQRHVMSKHRNAGPMITPIQTVPIFSQKCQWFRFEHPFISMIAEMTGSGKTAWVRSLLQQASETIYPAPERIVWCYSQLSLNGHLYKTDTSVKRTPRVGPYFPLLSLFDSL